MKKLFYLSILVMILALLFVGCSVLNNSGVVPSNKIAQGQIVWTGQGANALECELLGMSEERTEEGWIHWVLNQAKKVTSAELVLGGTGAGAETCIPTNITPGGVYHFFTPYFDIEGLTAAVNYQGELARKSQFVIADYCPGEDGGVVPINIVLSWGTCKNFPNSIEFQAVLVDPNGHETYYSDSGENKTVTTPVNTFIPGTYYYYVKNMSTYNCYYFADMNSFNVTVIDSNNAVVLETFDVSDATVSAINPRPAWKVFTFDGETGVITPVNEVNDNYAIPW